MLKKIVIKLLNIFNLAIFRKRNADIIYLEDWETLNQDQNKIFQKKILNLMKKASILENI